MNCSAINNGIDYVVDGTILAAGKTLTVTNCLTPNASSSNVAFKGGVQTSNSWQSPFDCNSNDFISVSITIPDATAARKADGSLPDITFMHLQAGSDLIDSGKNIGLPFNGTKPDLGCFETPILTGLTAIYLQDGLLVYPNPTTGILNINQVATPGSIIELYDATGQLVFVDRSDKMSVQLDLSSHPSGMYTVRCQFHGKTLHRTLVLER